MNKLKTSSISTKELINQYLAEGKEFRASDRFEDSIKSFRQVIELQPKSFVAHNELGGIFLKQKKWKRAIASYRKALKLKPNSLLVLRNLAKCHEETNNKAKVLEYLQQVVEQEENQPFWVYKTLGDLYEEQKHLENAISAYQAAVQIKPESFNLYAKLGKLQYQLGDAEAAESNLKQAISIESEQPSWVYKYLGDTCYVKSDWRGVIEAYQQAINLKRDLPIKVYINLAIAYLKNENLTQALDLEKDVIHGLKQEPENKTIAARFFVQLGNFFLETKDLSQAVKYHLKAVVIDPNVKEPYAKLRLVQTAMGFEEESLDQAISAYKQAIEENPNLPKTAYINLGDLLTKKEDYQQAVHSYKQGRKQQLFESCPYLTEADIDYSGSLKPAFMIIGAMKAGTTSLYSYITEHSQVIPAIKKEIRFFDQNVQAGNEWYSAHFPPVIKNQKFITGEASPSYMVSDIQQQILDWTPNVKIIAIMRNSAKRVLSHYSHNVRLGFESNSLEHVVSSVISDLKKISDTDNSETRDWIIQQNTYLSNSLYAHHLKKWQAAFPASQLLFLKSEDLFASPESTMKRVFDFLELPHEDRAKYKAYNPGAYSTKAESDTTIRLIEAFKECEQELLDLGIDISWNN